MTTNRNMRDGNKSIQPNTASLAPRLPALSINKLTQGQLKAVVPGLMQLATNSPALGNTAITCDWWQPNSPNIMSTQNVYKENLTTDVLRLMVRNCYRKLGQEDLLAGNSDTNWKSALARLTELQTNIMGFTKANKKTFDAFPDLFPGQGLSKTFVEIYVCFFCSEEFEVKEELRLHQSKCAMRPPELKSVQSLPTATPSSTDSCPQLSPLWNAEEGAMIVHSREVYMQGIDLIPVLKARKIRESRKRKTTEVELNVETFAEPETPKSPGTPRTPKSLISQMSKDGESSVCKRRLSYLCPRDTSSDADSVISSSSGDEHDEPQRPSKTLSLFTIDISSPLGQKVQNFMTADISTKVLADPESFCRTPVKDNFSEKLRARSAMVPITFKLTRKRLRQFNHLYKFTKSENEDAYARLKTGLNRGSRMLKKSIPGCRVVLSRLNSQEFRRWKANPNPPKVPRNWKSQSRKLFSVKKQILSNQPCSFPKGPPVLLTTGIDRLLGLRKKDALNNTKKSPLTLTNVLSEDANAEMTQLKLSLYTSLLTELSECQTKAVLQSSPLREQLQRSDTVFLSPCSVKMKPLTGGISPSRQISVSPLSPPSSTTSAKTKSASVTSLLSIEIPKDNFKLASLFSGNRKTCDLINDIDIGSDDSISIRTGSSDESYRCLSPEEVPCPACTRYLCKCKDKSKGKRKYQTIKQISKPSEKSDATSLLKRKIVPTKSSGLSTSKKNRNLTKNKKDCSLGIVKKYRRNTAIVKKLSYTLRGVDKPIEMNKIPKKLRIDMRESAFIPSVMLKKSRNDSKNVPKNLQIDMEWDPADSKQLLRVDVKKTSADENQDISSTRPPKLVKASHSLTKNQSTLENKPPKLVKATTSMLNGSPLKYSLIEKKEINNGSVKIVPKKSSVVEKTQNSTNKSAVQKDSAKMSPKKLDKNTKAKALNSGSDSDEIPLKHLKSKQNPKKSGLKQQVDSKKKSSGSCKEEKVNSSQKAKSSSKIISSQLSTASDDSSRSYKKLQMPKKLSMNMVWQPEDLPKRREVKPKVMKDESSENDKSNSSTNFSNTPVNHSMSLSLKPKTSGSLDKSFSVSDLQKKLTELKPSHVSEVTFYSVKPIRSQHGSVKSSPADKPGVVSPQKIDAKSTQTLCVPGEFYVKRKVSVVSSPIKTLNTDLDRSPRKEKWSPVKNLQMSKSSIGRSPIHIIDSSESLKTNAADSSPRKVSKRKALRGICAYQNASLKKTEEKISISRKISVPKRFLTEDTTPKSKADKMASPKDKSSPKSSPQSSPQKTKQLTLLEKAFKETSPKKNDSSGKTAQDSSKSSPQKTKQLTLLEKAFKETSPKKNDSSGKTAQDSSKSSPQKTKQLTLLEKSFKETSPVKNNSTGKTAQDNSKVVLLSKKLSESPKKKSPIKSPLSKSSKLSLKKKSQKESPKKDKIIKKQSKSNSPAKSKSPSTSLLKKKSPGTKVKTIFSPTGSPKKKDQRVGVTAASLLAGARGIKRKISVGKGVTPKAKKAKLSNT